MPVEMAAVGKLALSLLVLLVDGLSLLLLIIKVDDGGKAKSIPPLADAKGVAGLGKAGGDGSAGSDKAGQQVPPEVYNALTYAGTAFLFTLSVPLILYGLNKFLNWIEDCFGCGPSSKREKKQKALETERLKFDVAANLNNKPQQQVQEKRLLPALKHQSVANKQDGNNFPILNHQQQQLTSSVTVPLDSTTITMTPNRTSDTPEAHHKAPGTQIEPHQFIF